MNWPDNTSTTVVVVVVVVAVAVALVSITVLQNVFNTGVDIALLSSYCMVNVMCGNAGIKF